MHRTPGIEPIAHAIICSSSTPAEWESGDRHLFEFHCTAETALPRLGDPELDMALIDEQCLTTETSPQLAGLLNSTRSVPIVLVRRTMGSISTHANLAEQCFAVVDADCGIDTLKGLVVSAARFGRLQREHRRTQLLIKNRIARDLPGRSPAMQQLSADAARTALADGTILLQGERGTGLVELAAAVHDHSRRAHRPFLRVDCRVHTAELLERELFGTSDPETGSTEPGVLELAAGGTVCLDDVDALASPFQRKLLRVLERGSYHVPETTEIRALDARIAVVTYEPAHGERALQAGSFLVQGVAAHPQTCRLRSTPLRERLEDIAPLVEHALAQLAHREGRVPPRITVEGLRLLQEHEWTGNNQELLNVIESACATEPGPRLTAEMILPWLNTTDTGPLERGAGPSLREMERKLIEATFTRCGGNRERTAQILQIGLRTLSGKLREYGYPPRGGPGSNRQERRRAA